MNIKTIIMIMTISTFNAQAVIRIDINRSNNINTPAGWTGIVGNNGNSVTLSGATFTVFDSDGTRLRTGPTAVTDEKVLQDFMFSGGTDGQTGFTVDDLKSGTWTAQVYTYDASVGILDQAIGIIDFNGPVDGGTPSGFEETFFTTTFPESLTPFTFSFNTNDFANGFGIIVRESDDVGPKRVRFNGLTLTFVPEPSMFVLLASFSVLCRRSATALLRRRQKRVPGT